MSTSRPDQLMKVKGQTAAQSTDKLATAVANVDEESNEF